MQHQLLSTIRQFLIALDQTQDDLLALCEQKTIALRGSDVAAIRAVSETEQQLTRQMQLLLGERARILQQAAETAGEPFHSIQQYVRSIGSAESDELLPVIERSIQKSDVIRRESWVHWIIARRAFQHYSELIDIIAHCGEKSPTYSEGLIEDISGSTLLDASA